MRTYSVRQIIAILQDLLADGFTTLSKQELLEALDIEMEVRE